MSCGTRGQVIAALAGLSLLVFGCLLQIYWKTLLHNILKRKFILSPSSRTYDSWLKTKVPVYNKFYFFNWTNPSDFSDPEYKPEFQEVGPYVFVESLEKVDVAWHENGTVSYRLRRYWHFDGDLSKGQLTDRITSANPVVATVKYLTRHSFSISTLTRLATPDAVFMKSTKTVDELLFTGYSDQLISFGMFSQMLFSTTREMRYDRFGWFYPRNGSVSDVYNIETGENGMDTFGELRNWKHKSNTGFYNGSCGDVYGSGGNFWGWNRNKSGSIYIFSADICRYIRMEFSEEVPYGGLRAYRYESGPSLVDNGTLDKENECFCNGECVPSGVLNVSSCGKGAPVFISYPHFQFADPYYSEAVAGMKPDPKKHSLYLILEPSYGVPLELSAPVQINLLLETSVKSSVWNSEPKRRVFFPVFWVVQSFKIRDEDLKVMKLLDRLPRIGFIVSVVAMAAGAMLVFGFFICRTARRSRTVPFDEMRKKHVHEDKVTEPSDKNKIKFNYIGDSHL